MIDVAHLLPYSTQFPLQKHNGRYEWVLRLAKMQAAHGHKVTIYSAPESGKGISEIIWESSDYDFKDKMLNNLSLVHHALHTTRHDIYHSHYDWLHYLLADETTKPIVATQHWFPNEHIASASQLNATKNVIAVPVTNYMKQADEDYDIHSSKLISHGIDLRLFSPSKQSISDRLIYVGRISPQKGVHIVVEAARAAGAALDIIGKVNPKDEKYWKKILPFVDGERIRYLGSLTQPEVVKHLRQAKALLFAPQAPEAFGQVLIEAQACGTPVIVNDLGANNELLLAGRTGFIASDISSYVSAIKQVGSLSRVDCRTFSKNFDINTMFKNYDALYQELLTKITK